MTGQWLNHPAMTPALDIGTFCKTTNPFSHLYFDTGRIVSILQLESKPGEGNVINMETMMGMQAVHPKVLYFGTPVVLLTTLNEDGSSNITPMSSAWALGQTIILGLAEGGKALVNMERHGECVVNLPSPEMWRNVEKLAPLTGQYPVPEAKTAQFRYEKDKFTASGLTPLPSELVAPQRILECPLQIEGKILTISSPTSNALFKVIEMSAVRVHAHTSIVLDSTHINPNQWQPLIYNFRHYFGLSAELGKTFRAEI
jgi:flavin reductase (DIM6/NTAB) family NADH-FMN oxidoreductase RutF